MANPTRPFSAHSAKCDFRCCDSKSILGVVIDTVKGLGKAELVVPLLELQTSMRDLDGKLREVQEENRRLKELADIRVNSDYVCAFVFEVTNRGARNGHYCHICFETREKLIRVQRVKHLGRLKWLCEVCDKHFNDDFEDDDNSALCG